jgi:hypothetical protein
MSFPDPGCVKTSQASNPGEWFSQIAQNLPPSEIVIALNCSPKRQLFYQFSIPLRFYTTKTHSRPCACRRCQGAPRVRNRFDNGRT